MWYADDYIIEILSKLPSECAYLDYKLFPYVKDHYQDLMKDVIAMLNPRKESGIKRPLSLAFLIIFRPAYWELILF